MSKDSSSNKDEKWTPWVGLILGTFILYVAQIIVGIVFSFYPLIKHWNNAQASDWLSNSVFVQFSFIFVAEALALYIVLLFLKNFKIPFKDIGLRKFKITDPLFGVLGLPVYLFIYFIVLSTAIHLDKSLNINQKQQIGFNNVHGGVEILLAFISLVIFPPIAEEIIFRGLIYRSLKKIAPLWIAVILTSLLFAFPHLLESTSSKLLFIAGLDTFSLSLVLIYLREKTNGLYASMTLHALKNTIAFTALFALHLS